MRNNPIPPAWAKIRPGKPLFIEADEGRIRSLRTEASNYNRFTKLRFSVRKCRRGDVDGVRVERVA